ncbi:SsrA-binding protein [Candidatus Kuenenbacteria bacterium HGW-Kuenenbacteria-1]|uniref:SsrA-binding protein n=1 Tax=Candidatus Kuenenbacteria bacterium HGW-Kuenenbacteria-1 TaxID=2013812 RepID=A0A2N1UN99_9BACT|nr:MAG: SsrA-binding protein [Candidatus Kuenenbacteria bacterium HGW-Kuenenbacteria-1]
MPTITINKHIYHNYQILETFEAGIVLTGPEVKSLKKGQINLKGSYVTLDSKIPEKPLSNVISKYSLPCVWLVNCHISAYAPAANVQKNYQPTHSRKLLLKKKEINSLIGKLKTPGLTLLPIKVYTKGKIIKLEIGLGKGKKKFDKREDIKKREVKRKIERVMKNF